MPRDTDRRRAAQRIPPVPREALRVNLDDHDDVGYWCRKLACTEHQLREAVAQVGPMPSNVEAFVKQRTDSLHDLSVPPGTRPS
jgi:Protein of unknown function (DUF3606).